MVERAKLLLPFLPRVSDCSFQRRYIYPDFNIRLDGEVGLFPSFPGAFMAVREVRPISRTCYRLL